MQFDVIVSNPPYQKPANFVKDRHKRVGGLWWEFVKMFPELLHAGGHAAVVCPNSLFGGGYVGTGSFKLAHFLSRLQFTYLWPDVNHHFAVGINILAFVCCKTDETVETRVAGSDQTVVFDSQCPAPYVFTPTGYEIAKRTLNITAPAVPFRAGIWPGPDEAVLRLNGGRFKTWRRTFVGLERDTANNQQGAVIAHEHIAGYQSAVASELWEYLFTIYGAPAGQSPNFMRFFPVMPDMTRAYTDDEWYREFNITADEQAYIRSFLKK